MKNPAPFFGFLCPVSPRQKPDAAISALRPWRFIRDLRSADPAAWPATPLPQDAQILISCQQLFTHTEHLNPLPGWTGTLWIEIPPALSPSDPEFLLRRLRPLAEACCCIPVTGDYRLIERLALDPHGVSGLALKGVEAAGFVGLESVGQLFGAAMAFLARAQRRLDLHIWGGIATPEAAAAFLSTGAAGMVFENLHWLTDAVALGSTVRRRLETLRHDHLSVVGSQLGAACRVMNRGNSQTFRALREQASRLAAQGATEEEIHAFATQVAESATLPDEELDGRDPLILLGTEAPFAAGFMKRYGQRHEQAFGRFLAEIQACWQRVPQQTDQLREGTFASEMGVRYGIIQGAMSWISDSPDFAAQVAEAGGLPTLALGFMAVEEFEQRVAALKSLLGARPFALNVVALPENPHLAAQLRWIREHRPPLAVVGAGDPSFARQLEGSGIPTLCVVADEQILRLAFQGGVRCVILEGNEAGGHVGAHTTLTLAQIALELKRREPELFTGRHVVLAGGIHDRQSALRAVVLGASAVQMGTAYLGTAEIVETGALSPLYQRRVLEAALGETVLCGESIGLRVRSLRSPKVERILREESASADKRLEETARRADLEALAAGSLLIAARGRDPISGRDLDESTRLKEGQFMCGAAAGLLPEVRRLEQLHQEVASGALDLKIAPAGAKTRRKPDRTEVQKPRRERLAITAMALVNALGESPSSIWEACLNLRSGVVEVPPSRLKLSDFYASRPLTPGKTYCTVGAFQDLTIDRKSLGIPPQDFRTMSEATKVTLWLADQAVKASGILHSRIPQERIGVFVAQNSGEAASTLSHVILQTVCPEIIRKVQGVLPLDPKQTQVLEERLRDGLLPVDDTTLLGRLNSAAAGFICQRHGFRGPSFAVSAACATSLAALYAAMQLIHGGVLDAAVVGGAEERLSLAHYLEFAALGALAGFSDRRRPPAESSRPFDADRDGMVLGEGGGMIVLERESSARARGVPSHAFLLGMGASNSDQGMVESLAETQLIALRAAYRDTGLAPGQIDLVECHATGTVQGDAEEVQALKKIFPSGSGTVLSAFKSQIGHNLGAAGISSLIRAVLAMQQKTWPATLNYDKPDPELRPESWGFRIPRQPEDWRPPRNRSRRVQVDAFGFGGSNYVALLEESREAEATVLVQAAPIPKGLAFLFPGQGAHYAQMGRELYRNLPALRESLDRLAALAHRDLPADLFDARGETLQDTRWQQPALFSLEVSLAHALQAAGLQPDALAGHSVGELSALCVAGVFSPQDGLRIAEKRAQLMAAALQAQKEQGAMLAVAAPPAEIKSLLHGQEGLFVANINSPRQVALSGPLHVLQGLREKLLSNGTRAVLLRVGAAFHSPWMEPVVTPLRQFLETIPFSPPGRPVVSNATGRFYPHEPGEIRNLLASQAARPVLWWEGVERLSKELSIGRFLEVGPGSTLCDLAAEDFAGVLCLPTCLPGRESQTCSDAIGKLSSARSVSTVAADGPGKNVSPDEPALKATPAMGSARPGTEGILEPLIRIIMGATGYERSEIEADMDLRQDLAIRSSRLPVIIDAAERCFGIAVRLEDFIHVRTVRQVAEQISLVIGRDGNPPKVQGWSEPLLAPAQAMRPLEDAQSTEQKSPLKRLLLSEVPLAVESGAQPCVARGQQVQVLTGRPQGDWTQQAAGLLESRWGVSTRMHPCLGTAPEGQACDLRDGAGLEELIQRIGREPPAGIIVLLEQMGPETLSVDQVPAVLQGLFRLLQALLVSPQARFFALVFRQTGPKSPWRVVAEGVTGMLLAAKHEYSQMGLRCISLDEETPLETALEAALSSRALPVHLACLNGRVHRTVAREAPLNLGAERHETLRLGDVVVVSGGARGVTSHLAAALAPFRPHLILLGRTRYGGEDGIAESSPEAASEVRNTLQTLKDLGLKADYETCDVIDPKAVSEVLERVARKHGKIDVVIHGAGILRDAFLSRMSPEEFIEVVDVKVKGACNLWNEACRHGLRLFTALSSVVALMGNLGQCNYAAANRALTALVEGFRQRDPARSAKAFVLPPIEGVGMAIDPETRAFLKHRGLQDSFLQLPELAEMFCRELFLAPSEESAVLHLRVLPHSIDLPIEKPQTIQAGAVPAGGGCIFEPCRFPLIGRIETLDLTRGEMTAERIFDWQTDLWLPDHRPFPFMKHPVVSGVMIVELFLEAAQLFLPYLRIQSLRQVQFLDILECPQGAKRRVRVACRTAPPAGAERVCRMSLLAEEMNPPEGKSARWNLISRAEVHLAAYDDAIKAPEIQIDWRSLSPLRGGNRAAARRYEMFTALKGRYRILETVEAVGEGAIQGRMIYPQSRDFSAFANGNTLYSPYLLEALFHLVGNYSIIKNRDNAPKGLPSGFGKLRYTRHCIPGEKIVLWAQLQEEDPHGQRWDGWAVSAQGEVLLSVRDSHLRWLEIGEGKNG